jgi:hypothetical protein
MPFSPRPGRVVFPWLAALVLLGARQGAADDGKAKRTCVNGNEINAISSLDARHAFVKVGVRRFHVFTLDESCQDFARARRIAVSERSGRVCNDGMTLLVFETPAAGTMRCRIEAIDAVADKEAARRLIESRAEPQ